LTFCWMHNRLACRLTRRPAAKVACERLGQTQGLDEQDEDDGTG
jgi:hypothetical protein